ncbi:phage integrase N-terminal SAM-like domain-containing protein [Paenibacillus xylanexedens]|uniref:phage integrase N-terminal SAM-like domain-containing protein n=1 Tax=Paenibacillus xylanexedens TaxID=528191 RepID=UPI0021B2FD26|nr:phage integrase N-terminal SAM-like domain-containing protein [Paenibacillus xylanexedens]
MKAYCNQVERFLSSCHLESTNVTTSNVQMYCLDLLERGISHSSVNQTISAILLKFNIYVPKSRLSYLKSCLKKKLLNCSNP